MNNKVLFLDIDGVLNSKAYFKRNRGKSRTNTLGEAGAIDPSAVARLNRIVEETGADVVVSSTWRLIYSKPGLEEFLKKRGYKHSLLDMTPYLAEWKEDEETGKRYETERERGYEIRTWLDGHPEVTSFAVVDDNGDMSAVRDHFVQTDFDDGLTDELADKLILLIGAI